MFKQTNELTFEYTFVSSYKGEKRTHLSVFIDGERVHELEENIPFDESKMAIVKLNKTFPIGKYLLTLRVDRYGAKSTMNFDNFKIS